MRGSGNAMPSVCKAPDIAPETRIAILLVIRSLKGIIKILEKYLQGEKIDA